MKLSSAIRVGSALVWVAFGLAVPRAAEAGTITFNYNCQIVNATACTPGGPYGSITLTDSAIDPERVDISVTLNLANIQTIQPQALGLNNFFLNYNQALIPNTTFKMVLVTDADNAFNNNGGDVSVNLNNQGPDSTTLDFKLDPAGSTASVTFAASLGLYADAGPNHTQTNLDVTMFTLKDNNNLLYSAFDTLPTGGGKEFHGGALTIASVTAVPEPGTITLLGLGISGLAVRLRARKR